MIALLSKILVLVTLSENPTGWEYEALARTIMSTGDEVAALKAEMENEHRRRKKAKAKKKKKKKSAERRDILDPNLEGSHSKKVS